MMQIYAVGSVEAAALYVEAFGATLTRSDKNADGSYLHAELDVFGQVVAIAEAPSGRTSGDTMQFCFDLGPGSDEAVKHAYEVLKQGAEITLPLGETFFSPCVFGLTDRFGVSWCLLV